MTVCCSVRPRLRGICLEQAPARPQAPHGFSRMDVSGLRKHRRNDETAHFCGFRMRLTWILSTEEMTVSSLRPICPRSPNAEKAKPRLSHASCDLSLRPWFPRTRNHCTERFPPKTLGR